MTGMMMLKKFLLIALTLMMLMSTACAKDLISASDRAKLDGWGDNRPSDELYLQFKDVFDDPLYYETLWGQPVTTKDIIQGLREAGFDTLRVPVAWMTNATHLGKGENDYTISSAYLDRVETIVGWALDEGMYVILNDHWDGGWYGMFGSDTEATRNLAMEAYRGMWKQIAERFADYDSHLIFETLNEPRLCGNKQYEWWIDTNNADCKDAMDCVNKLNAAALDSIRKSGGNNAKRFVMMPTYAASPDAQNLAGYSIPNDDHIIAEIHAYRPYAFALANDGTQVSTFNEDKDKGELVDMFNNLKNKLQIPLFQLLETIITIKKANYIY